MSCAVSSIASRCHEVCPAGGGKLPARATARTLRYSSMVSFRAQDAVAAQLVPGGHDRPSNSAATLVEQDAVHRRELSDLLIVVGREGDAAVPPRLPPPRLVATRQLRIGGVGDVPASVSGGLTGTGHHDAGALGGHHPDDDGRLIRRAGSSGRSTHRVAEPPGRDTAASSRGQATSSWTSPTCLPS